MKLISSLAAVSLASLISATASASVSVHNYEPCGSTDGFGSFLATVTYTYTSGTTAGVSVVLNNNTTPVSSGGYITGLLLNVNATGISFVSCTNANFMNTGPASGAPYGSFMSGAALGGNWLGGGNPNDGIAIGSSATFTFSMSGTAAALSAISAADVFAIPGGNGMAVRFKGGTDPKDWSDKVLGCPAPAPGAAALIGLAGLVSSRRRRN